MGEHTRLYAHAPRRDEGPKSAAIVAGGDSPGAGRLRRRHYVHGSPPHLCGQHVQRSVTMTRILAISAAAMRTYNPRIRQSDSARRYVHKRSVSTRRPEL